METIVSLCAFLVFLAEIVCTILRNMQISIPLLWRQLLWKTSCAIRISKWRNIILYENGCVTSYYFVFSTEIVFAILRNIQISMSFYCFQNVNLCFAYWFSQRFKDEKQKNRILSYCMNLLQTTITTCAVLEYYTIFLVTLSFYFPLLLTAPLCILRSDLAIFGM